MSAWDLLILGFPACVLAVVVHLIIRELRIRSSEGLGVYVIFAAKGVAPQDLQAVLTDAVLTKWVASDSPRSLGEHLVSMKQVAALIPFPRRAYATSFEVRMIVDEFMLRIKKHEGLAEFQTKRGA